MLMVCVQVKVRALLCALGSGDYRNDKRYVASQTPCYPIGIWACESFVLYAQENWITLKDPGAIPFFTQRVRLFA